MYPPNRLSPEYYIPIIIYRIFKGNNTSGLIHVLGEKITLGYPGWMP